MRKRTKTERMRTHYVSTEDGRLVLVPGDPTPLQKAAGWMVWHIREVAGVLTPFLLAVVLWPWLWPLSLLCWLVSATVATVWVVGDVRRSREHAADVLVLTDAGTSSDVSGEVWL